MNHASQEHYNLNTKTIIGCLFILLCPILPTQNLICVSYRNTASTGHMSMELQAGKMLLSTGLAIAHDDGMCLATKLGVNSLLVSLPNIRKMEYTEADTGSFVHKMDVGK
jgi:hypothetical protein